MATCSLVLLLTLIHYSSAFFPDEIHQIKTSIPYVNPKQFLLTPMSSGKLNGADTGFLSVSPSVVSSNTEWITVSWHNISYTGKYDWIGMFNASEAGVSYSAPPIKYQYVCPAYDGCYYAPASGSLQFKILNRRTNYIFAYVTESNPYREIKGVTPVISYSNRDLYKPMNVHIATPINVSADCGKTSACIQIMWIQKAFSNPKIKFGLSADKLDGEVTPSAPVTLSRDDLCGQSEGLPAGTSGFFETGYMISGNLLNLHADTQYFYQVGDDAYGWTEIYNFTSQPLNGQMPKRGDQRMIIFGDMGNVAIDYSMHHSWDFGNQGEIYSVNTTNAIHAFTNGEYEITDSLIHIGDISYAVGYLSEWDDFFHQIGPTATQIPWMTGIGNHEYSWTGEWKPPSEDVNGDAYGNADGGGECGVPYNFYFPFANSNQAESKKAMYDPTVVKPWYVFDYGVVRTIIFSSEHDYGKDSEQYEFIANALGNTDRSIFPWVFIASHRPMYANDDWDGDTTTSSYMRDSLESLLFDHGVALGFYGHQHSYGRTCPVYGGKCYDDGKATVHLITGMAGYSLTKSIQPAEYTVFQNNTIYGFVHLTVHNDSIISGKFINANTSETVDDFRIVNPYTSALQ